MQESTPLQNRRLLGSVGGCIAGHKWVYTVDDRHRWGNSIGSTRAVDVWSSNHASDTVSKEVPLTKNDPVEC